MGSACTNPMWCKARLSVVGGKRLRATAYRRRSSRVGGMKKSYRNRRPESSRSAEVDRQQKGTNNSQGVIVISTEHFVIPTDHFVIPTGHFVIPNRAESPVRNLLFAAVKNRDDKSRTGFPHRPTQVFCLPVTHNLDRGYRKRIVETCADQLTGETTPIPTFHTSAISKPALTPYPGIFCL